MKDLGFYLALALVLGVCANQAFAQQRATGEEESTQELLPKIRLFADNLIGHGRDRYAMGHYHRDRIHDFGYACSDYADRDEPRDLHSFSRKVI